MFNKVHHVAYAVEDIDQAIDLFQNVVGLKLQRRWVAEAQGNEFAVFEVDGSGSVLEVISPHRPDTDVAKFIKEHGQGLYHVGYGIHDFDRTLAALQAAGLKLTSNSPRVAFNRVARGEY